MSFFHRPGDSSSSDDESSEEEEELDVSLNDQTHDSAKDSTGTTDEIVERGLTPTETLSLTNSIGEDGNIVSLEEHRNMMLATMLEELAKYKAAEMLNNANAGAGKTFDKNCSEVQEFAKTLFASSTGMLSSTGLLSADAASEEKRTARQQYLAGLERWNYQNAVDGTRWASGDRGELNAADGQRALMRRQNQQPTPFQGTTAGQLQQFNWETSQINMVRRPSAEFQLASPFPIRVRSHYSSHFEERGLLGRGGFGRVYRTYNLLDRREYAIKKIPLSPKLSQRYRQGGHGELAHILREVQALARLDHCNVVRYHGTWIEEPAVLPQVPIQPTPIAAAHTFRGQLLLENKPSLSSSSPTKLQPRASHVREDDSIDVFDRASSNNDKQLWSHQNPQTPSISGAGDTNPFSDGRSPHNQLNAAYHLDDPTVHILHVQMSMYPMTLSDYLLPHASPRKSSSNIRHCFHLLPALRILLAILSGLQYIHAAGFIHRDIKPSNIFLSHLDFASPLAFSEGYADTGSCPSCPDQPPRFLNPRIGDFGLVADLEKVAGGGDSGSASTTHRQHRPDSDPSTNKVVGTEYYRPPSHGKSSETTVDEKIDVFALGVIFLELLYTCGTRMERMDLLQGAQRGAVPKDLEQTLLAQSPAPSVAATQEIVEMTMRLASGMVDPDPKTRWRCGMVKSGIEGLLAKIAEHTSTNKDMPD